MAHFAELSENNTVLRVIVVANEDNQDQDGKENEVIGAKYCHDLLGGRWIQTSYNGNMRGRFAGIGYLYDSVKDEFIGQGEYELTAQSDLDQQTIASE
jgi:hypothetical protein